MKSLVALAGALALCGSAFAVTAHGAIESAKQEAHQIGNSFRQDLHRIARADKFRQEQAAGRRVQPHTSAMGAGADHGSMSGSRQARMDAAYANWQRSHR